MSFLQLFLADLRSMLRNRMALFWFLAFPVIFILIFGSVFANEHPPSFRVGFVHTAGDPLAEGLQAGLSQASALRLQSGTLESELAALRKGERSIVVEVPRGAAQNAARGTPTTLRVHYDKAQEQTARLLNSILVQALDEAERRSSGRARLFETRLEPLQASPLRPVDFLLPGILAMTLMQLGFFGSFQLVALRENKVLKALGATPLPRLHVLGAEVLVRLLLSLVQLALTLGIGRAAFGLRVGGNWLAVLGVVVLGALTFTSLGYMLTCRARSVDSGQGLVQLVQFPMMFLSGVFFPVQLLPGFLRPVSNALPLTYLGDALRWVMVGMPSQHSLLACVLVLGAWLAGSVTIAVVFWRWE